MWASEQDSDEDRERTKVKYFRVNFIYAVAVCCCCVLIKCVVKCVSWHPTEITLQLVNQLLCIMPL